MIDPKSRGMSDTERARICIFCLRHESDPRPWCPENPGLGCTYALAHEYEPGEEAKPKQPERRLDKELCVRCGLHPKNPASATNGCAHEYPSEASP